jgi:hypothetical protein
MLAAAISATPATAGDSVSTDSAVFIETAAASGGRDARTLSQADHLRRGDRVVLLVNWQSNDRKGFTITSEVPAHLAFRESASQIQNVSVDGGRNWGLLGQLTMRDHYGERIARPADVTHLRWHVSARDAVGKHGSIAYSATVR